MRYVNRPPRSHRLIGIHKGLSQLGLVILFFMYWSFAFQLEQIDYVPGAFAAVANAFSLFGDVLNPVVLLIERIGPYFSFRVLRHLIPPLVGWFFARQAILGLLQSFYDLPDSEAAAGLLYRLSQTRLGFVKPTVITLQNFETLKQTNPVLKIGGPGRIVVFKDAALVTELNGRFHRVCGPGRHDLGRFEFARTLIDLRPQERETQNVALMTSDGIKLTADLTVTFQIIPGENEPTKSNPFPYDEEAVRIAAYTETVQPDGNIGRWSALPIVVASGQLRGVVAEEALDDLIVPEANGIDVHRRLQMEMERRTRNIMRNFGVKIRGTRLGALNLEKEVEDLRKDYWQSHWNTQRTMQRADGEVEVLESQESARAEAEAVMLRAIAEGLQRAQRAGRDVTSREVVALRLIESLEAMARNSEQLLSSPNDLVPQLGTLRQQLMLISGTTEETENQE